MILQALNEYYQRKASEDGTQLAPPGFEKKEIPFVVVLDQEGHFVDLEDMRTREGKKKTGRPFIVPQSEERSGKNSWQTASLLWDHIGYVLGYSKENAERARRQHQSFLARIESSFPDSGIDIGVEAVKKFLRKGNFNQVYSHPLWQEIKDLGPNISFRLQHDNELVCQRQAVRQVITQQVISPTGQEGYCLVSGEQDIIAQLHPPIKGVKDSQTTGGKIVSFNLEAFNSYGKTQSLNAPVGKRAVFAYTTALNHLLRKGSRQRMQVGDASTVFWAEKSHPVEDSFLDWIEPDQDDPDRNIAAVRALYAAPQTGAPPIQEDETRFYVLGLAPNAARLAIRFWYQSTVGELARHIRQHFDDIQIDHGPREPEYLSLFRLLSATALQSKAENISPNLAGEVMKAILAGTPYPHTLLSAAIRRIRAEQARKNEQGRSLPHITYARAALIKAVLVRDNRFLKRHQQEVDVSLDEDNANAAYRLGRLFAVLERVQEAANPGINATIRDRFYSSASATPVTVFPHLLKLKNYHIGKLDNRGQVVNLEKLIGRIIDGIDSFPAHLSLDDQGRFAIGYYHQRQTFFRKFEEKLEKGEQA